MTKKVKVGRVSLFLYSSSTHISSSLVSNSGGLVRFKGQEAFKKNNFTMKERSHENSFVFTGKLASKEEEWNSQLRAVYFQYTTISLKGKDWI